MFTINLARDGREILTVQMSYVPRIGENVIIDREGIANTRQSYKIVAVFNYIDGFHNHDVIALQLEKDPVIINNK